MKKLLRWLCMHPSYETYKVTWCSGLPAYKAERCTVCGRVKVLYKHSEFDDSDVWERLDTDPQA